MSCFHTSSFLKSAPYFTSSNKGIRIRKLHTCCTKTETPLPHCKRAKTKKKLPSHTSFFQNEKDHCASTGCSVCLVPLCNSRPTKICDNNELAYHERFYGFSNFPGLEH